MREYEGLFIIDPGKEESLKEIEDFIASNITKRSGKVEKQESWGRQKLAYPIRKNREGVYYKLEFSIEPSEISGLQDAYKLNSDILRVIITQNAKR